MNAQIQTMEPQVKFRSRCGQLASPKDRQGEKSNMLLCNF